MPLEVEPRIDGSDTHHTIVFLQGWPDDASLWDHLIVALIPRYRCVRVTMPNYDGHKVAPRGYRTEQIVEALADCVRKVCPHSPPTLVLHDWGSYWGHMMHYRYPELASRIATLDVSPHFRPGLLAVAGITAYQSWLAAAFLIGGRVGDAMTRTLATLFGAPRPASEINSWMNYPYRNIWGDLAHGRASMPGYWPQIPLLLVYGKRKPFPFHSKRWESHVRKVGGEVIALDCNHWVTQDPAFTAILTRWLDQTEPARAAPARCR